MKTSQRLLLILGPLAMVMMSLLLYHRADRRFDQLTQEVFEARAALDEALEKDRAALRTDLDKLLYERHAKETGRGFWGFATGVSVFFLALAFLFAVFELRHSRQRTRMLEERAGQ